MPTVGHDPEADDVFGLHAIEELVAQKAIKGRPRFVLVGPVTMPLTKRVQKPLGRPGRRLDARRCTLGRTRMPEAGAKTAGMGRGGSQDDGMMNGQNQYDVAGNGNKPLGERGNPRPPPRAERPEQAGNDTDHRRNRYRTALNGHDRSQGQGDRRDEGPQAPRTDAQQQGQRRQAGKADE